MTCNIWLQFDDIVNKYINKYHNAIKMKPVNVKSNTYINSSTKINDKDPKLNLMILLEYQNIKHFLQKPMFVIDLNKFL